MLITLLAPRRHLIWLLVASLLMLVIGVAAL
jgi:hypothetical protein